MQRPFKKHLFCFVEEPHGVTHMLHRAAAGANEIPAQAQFSASFSQDANGNLRFRDTQGALNLSFNGTVQKKFLGDRFKVKGEIFGDGTIRLGLPEPFVRSMKANAWARLTFGVDMWVLGDSEKSFEAVFGCKWSSGGVTCKPGGYSSPVGDTLSVAQRFASPFTREDTSEAVSTFHPAYERFGACAVFEPRARAALRDSRTALSTGGTSLLGNVYPDAQPHLLEVGKGKLLLWEHQDPASAGPFVNS